MHRRMLLAGAACSAAPWRAARADLPDRTLSIIVPTVPGGTTDILGRLIAQTMAEALGRTIIVENIGGAGGLLGMQRMVRAPVDGGTLLVGNPGILLAAPLLLPGPGLDAQRDLRPVGIFGEVPAALAASRASGIRSMAGFIERARVRPARLTLGVSGVGAATHLAAAALIEAAGLQVTLVPYRGGGQSMADLAAGTIDLAMELAPGIIAAAAGGHAVPLAVGGRAQVPELPGVPTFAEAGIADYPGIVWYALMAPAAASDAAIATYAAAIGRALRGRALLARFHDLAVTPPPEAMQGPEPLRRLLAEDGMRIGALVRAGRIREN